MYLEEEQHEVYQEGEKQSQVLEVVEVPSKQTLKYTPHVLMNNTENNLKIWYL